MASEGKKSSSRSRSTSRRLVQPAKKHVRRQKATSTSGQYAICVRNDEYPAALELRKLYRVLDDDFAEEHKMLRVVDESGEDYLFPRDYFVRVTLPASVESRLREIA